MTRVKPLTCLFEIRNGHVRELQGQLKKIENDLFGNDLINFKSISSLHFGRFFIIDEVKKNEKRVFPAYLVLSTNYDGSLDDHLLELCSNADLDPLFMHCKLYNDENTQEEQIEYIKHHANYKAYFYAGNWGQKVEEIKQSTEARKKVEAALDNMQDYNRHPGEIREDILKVLAKENVEVNSPPNYGPLNYRKYTAIACIAALVLLPLLGGLLPNPIGSFILNLYASLWILVLVGLVLGALWLMILESTDKELEDLYSPQKHVEEMSAKEDQIVQNQFTSVVEVKPGFLRLYLLKAVLSIVGFAGDYLFYKGKLGSIPTIHFARWVLIDNGRRLMFLSNFDGSWESYLGDFVDKAARGLTAIWSNTKDFPRSFLLVGKGARDERRFKAVARLNQVYTNVWYSAYPELTVTNIILHKELQGILKEPKSETEIKKVLMKL